LYLISAAFWGLIKWISYDLAGSKMLVCCEAHLVAA
jgi:hypothetical protein